MEDRVILHCDLNNFFASVSLLFNPTLRSLPVAVCGDKEQRHGILLFTAVHSADFPLFPSRPARFFRILGQKWVKENFTITNFEYAVYLLVYEILFFFSLSIKPVNKEETNTTVV